VEADGKLLVVRQPRSCDLDMVRQALKKGSEYTYLRYQTFIWEHPEGICNLPLYNRGSEDILYMIMILDNIVVGFTHHNYWILDEETKEFNNIPAPTGSKVCGIQLCILDPYQNQGIGSLYGHLSEFIAKHNGAAFVMGETHTKGGMVNIRLRSGWQTFGRRTVIEGDERVLVGKMLE